MNDNAEHFSGSHNGYSPETDLSTGWGRRFVRLFMVTIGVIVFGIVLGGIGLFFLFQGGAIENEALNGRVEHSITTVLGSQYNVELGATKFEFHGLGKISITSTNVKVNRIGESKPVAVFGKVLVGVSPLSLLRGKPKIHNVTIESSKLDLRQFLAATALGFPNDMNRALMQYGQKLRQIHARFAVSELQNIAIKNSVLTGYKPGRLSTGKIAIDEFVLEVISSDELNMQLAADTGVSKINANAVYRNFSSGNSSLDITFDGLNAREWVHDPNLPKDEDVPFASDSQVNGRLNLSFNEDNSVQQPVLNIIVGEGELHLGRKGRTHIKSLALNLRLFPKLNRIILERSQIFIGGLRAQLVGGITPVDLTRGLAGNIDYTLVVERAQGSASQSGEKIHPGSMIVEGRFNREKKLLNIDQWKIAVAGGSMVGSASLGFKKVTPSLVLNGVSNGMPMAALKQFWPIFLATPVRKWVQEHVHGGQITSAIISASIPGGILGRLHKGKRIGEDQLTMDIEVENARFDTFGKLPPVRSASGTVHVQGMRTNVKLVKGVAYVAVGEPINITSGEFTIPDISVRPLKAETSFFAQGPVPSLAQIANAEPLNVMNRLKMSPTQWTGDAELDLVARFPLKKNIKYHNVTWQALVRLEGANSSKLINGRKISHANVVVDVSPDKAVITGNSTIDGIRGQVRIIEPVGTTSKIRRKQILKARMGAAERSKIGLVVEPVISGPVDVVMEQNEGRKTADITVDLMNAEIALPWIGWRKGMGIAAKASFKMIIGKKQTSISDLAMRGRGFRLNGDIEIDKKGIRSANFPNLSLNKNDQLDVRIRRNKEVYTITANGKYFDGRVLINKLFHKKGNSGEQSEPSNANFNLSVNIQRVKGFGNRNADNLIMHYKVKNGWLNALSLNTRLENSQVATIEADTRGNTTGFKIRSANAGIALAYLNLYTRMVDGVLVAELKRKPKEPFFGDVFVKDFIVVDEPRLRKLVSNQQVDDFDRGGRLKSEFNKIQTNRVHFPSATAKIEKGQGYLKMDGSLTGVQIGLTYNGTLYDSKNRMDVRGTFMPAFGISRIVSAIPFVGQILSNGKDSGLIGITYHLSGPAISPKLELNPLSIVAPGIFKKVFEQRIE